tara:strand:- start:212 stop:1957 length:1746 start_codon:yes stop_codon:yes gene_type:complete
MATHDYVIANASGAAVRADLNNALAAIVSNNSNATSPATTYAFQFWADTTASQLKIRNAANDAWIVLMELDGTMLMEDGTAAAPGLAFSDDVDTGLFRPAANQLGIATSGVERVEFGTTEVVFNDSGADVDFRVEGDAETNLLKVDAGNDRIGIAESAPGTLVEIGSTAPYVTLKNSTEEDTDGGRESRLIFEGEQSGGEISTLAQVEVSHDGTADDEKGKLVISTNDGSDGASPTAALTISADQTVAVADNLTVNGNQYPTAGALSHRNMMMNGDMRIDQRNAGSSTTPTADQTHVFDRWMIRNAGGSGRFSVQSSGVSPNNIDPSMLLTVTTTDAPAAGEFYGVEQRVEGYVLSPSAIGSADAKALTLSFYVRSSLTGTYCCSFRNANADRSFVAEYSISTANTWEFKKIQIEAKTDGTWNSTNTVGAYVNWCLGSGGNFEGSTGWQSVNRVATSNQVDWINTSGATFHLTGVQLELGEKVTPFEYKSFGDELARCQRYYQESDINEYYQLPSSSGAQIQRQKVTFPVTMRDTPNVTRTKVDGNATISSDGASAQGFRSGFGGSAADVINYSWIATADL